MGGKSKSSSSSSTTTNTQNLALEDVDGITFAGTDSVNFEMDSPEAFDLAASAVDGVVDVAGGLFGFLNEQQKRATDQTDNALNAIDKTSETALAAVQSANQSENSQAMEALAKVAMVGIGVWGAAKVFKVKL